MKLTIAAPYRIPRGSFKNPEGRFEPPKTIDIDLEDPRPHREYLQNLILQCAELNVEVVGVMFPALPYFALTTHLRALLVKSPTRGEPADVLIFDGVRIYMDPMRDTGDPVPIFDDQNALNLWCLRRESAQTTKGKER